MERVTTQVHGLYTRDRAQLGGRGRIKRHKIKIIRKGRTFPGQHLALSTIFSQSLRFRGLHSFHVHHVKHNGTIRQASILQWSTFWLLQHVKQLHNPLWNHLINIKDGISMPKLFEQLCSAAANNQLCTCSANSSLKLSFSYHPYWGSPNETVHAKNSTLNGVLFCQILSKEKGYSQGAMADKSILPQLFSSRWDPPHLILSTTSKPSSVKGWRMQKKLPFPMMWVYVPFVLCCLKLVRNFLPMLYYLGKFEQLQKTAFRG